MKHAKVLLIAVLLLSVMSVSGLAQESKPADQKPPIQAAKSDEPKNEVDEMLLAAKKRGEMVLGVCLEECRQNPDARIEGEFEKGRALELPKPTYPALARAAHVSGTVQVRVVIDEEGKVVAAAAVSGHPLLYAACVRAARDSVFSPTKLDGKAVKVTGVMQYNFVAQ